MADKQRAAPGAKDTNHGIDSADGSDISDAASAWESILGAEDAPEEDETTEAGGDEEVTDDADQEDPEAEAEDDESEDEADDDESEDDEDEDDSEDDDEEDDQPSEIDPNAKVKVKVDGEEVEVTVDELKAGYSRTQDYTRKTQEAAEIRRSAEQEKSKVLQQQQEWSNALDQLGQHLQAMQTSRSEADWQKLKQEDELAYYEERDKDRTVKERLQAIKAEQQRVAQEQTEYQQEQLKQQAQAEFQQLLNVVPEWQDQEARTKDFSRINAYGQEVGYTPEELGAVIDHRAIRVLRDAAKYRELLAAKEKTAAKKTPSKVRTKPLKPGTPSGKAPSSVKRKKASQRLAKEHTVEAAAGVFEHLFDD